jgi:uncharacterized protein (TIGR03435 family)
MRISATILLMALSSVAARSQSAEAPVAFEVASIKSSPPPDGRGMRVGCPASDPGRIACTNINLANLVTMAYGIAHYQLVGLSLSDSDRFEIAVKIPAGATKDQIKLMWQTLLAERFKLAVHREKKEVPVYELVVAKGGPKMQESVEEPPTSSDTAPAPPMRDGPPKLDKDGFPDLPPGRGTSMAMMNGKARWRATKETTGMLASMLGTQLSQPVTDATGLKGKYDFTLSWVTGSFGGGRGGAAVSQPEGGSPLAGMSEPDDGPTLFSAVQSQLGLKLEQKKGSIEVLVVDHAERMPTEN